MQNLNFSRCLIFQPLFIWEAEISVTGICLTAGFTFSASNHLPNGAAAALGIRTPPPFTDDVQSNIWGPKYLARWKPLGFSESEGLWHMSAGRGWSLLSLHSRMHVSGRTVRSRSSGGSFRLHPLLAHAVHPAALRAGDFSAESVFCLLPRFHFCSYRLVHPCKENNT